MINTLIIRPKISLCVQRNMLHSVQVGIMIAYTLKRYMMPAIIIKEERT